MIVNSRITKYNDIYRYLSYSNFSILTGLANYHKLETLYGGFFLSTFLISVVRVKNPFNKLLQTLFELSKESNYEMNYRNIDSFLNFNEENLMDFLSTENKNEMYYNSVSNIIRTLSFSYVILTRETIVNSMKEVIDPMLSDRMFSLIEKYFYPLKIPSEEKLDLLKNCTCSTKEIKNIAMISDYYRKVILNNLDHSKKEKKLLSFLFQSSHYSDLCSTIMFAFKQNGLNEICDLKGTSTSMYHNSSTFMVNKRVQKNYKEALNSNQVPGYLPEILGTVLATINFAVRSFITGHMFKSIFSPNASIYLMSVQNMKRNTRTSSIDEIQKTSALLEATNLSSQKAYICFSSDANIDPALVNRHILLNSKNKYLACFFTSVRRKVFQLKWKGLLPEEPIEKIVSQLFYATYGKYSAREVGWAIEQRVSFLFQNKDKFPFMINSILKWF